jgi:hypothetical protein
LQASPFVASHVHAPPHPLSPLPAQIAPIGLPLAHPAIGVQHEPEHEPATQLQFELHVSV